MIDSLHAPVSDAGPSYTEDGPKDLADFLELAMDEIRDASRLRDDSSVVQKRRQREAIDRARVWLQAADATLLSPGEAAARLGTWPGEEVTHDL